MFTYIFSREDRNTYILYSSLKCVTIHKVNLGIQPGSEGEIVAVSDKFDYEESQYVKVSFGLMIYYLLYLIKCKYL